MLSDGHFQQETELKVKLRLHRKKQSFYLTEYGSFWVTAASIGEFVCVVEGPKNSQIKAAVDLKLLCFTR